MSKLQRRIELCQAANNKWGEALLEPNMDKFRKLMADANALLDEARQLGPSAECTVARTREPFDTARPTTAKAGAA